MKITEPGIYDMPLAEYIGQPCDGPCIGSSDAQTLTTKTPAHLKAEWAKERTRERRADIGTAIHALILEPFRAESLVQVIDAKDFKTNAAKEEADAAMAAGKAPVLKADYFAAKRAADAVLSDPDARRYLSNGQAEQSYFARDAKSGIWVKARPDYITHKGAMADIKTVGSCDEEFIKRRIYEGGWYQQAPWHAHVYERVKRKAITDYVWICVEQDEPHAVLVFRPLETALMHGADKNAKALALFAKCVVEDSWPAYGRGVREVGLPDYAYYRLEAEGAREEEAAMRAAKYARELGVNPFS